MIIDGQTSLLRGPTNSFTDLFKSINADSNTKSGVAADPSTNDGNSSAMIVKSSPIMQVMERCNAFFLRGCMSMQGVCRPLVACGKQIGMIRPDVGYALENYPDVFTATSQAFYFNNRFDTYKSRSEAIDAVLRDLRAKNSFIALRGWREECFNVWTEFGSDPIFQIERSAVTLLGLRTFSVHINGYTRTPCGNIGVWLQKRSATKPTWPGMLDSMVSGGLTAGLKPSEVVQKEAEEEASIPPHLICNAFPAGTVSFYTETERGIHANTEFVYDLELPADFTPINSDGEVEGFELVLLQELLPRVLSSKYKMTSAPIAIDFLLRRGFINADNEPNLPALQELLHVPLHTLYNTGILAIIPGNTGINNTPYTPPPESSDVNLPNAPILTS